MHISLAVDLLTRLKDRSDGEAISVFAKNLKDLLLAAPAGPRATMGLDPGIRTGVKVAVVDQTGKLLDTSTVYPHEPKQDWDGALATLGALCLKHKVDLISIGNGTASRETDKLAADLHQGPAATQHDQGDGVRSRRLGLFRVGTRRRGVPQPRRELARRRVDRPPPAGPSRRTGQDRA